MAETLVNLYCNINYKVFKIYYMKVCNYTVNNLSRKRALNFFPLNF